MPRESPSYLKIEDAYRSRPKTWKKLEKLAAVLGIEGLDLLWHCLALNPDARVSAQKALSHAFFDEIREEMTEIYSGKKGRSGTDRKIDFSREFSSPRTKKRKCVDLVTSC